MGWFDRITGGGGGGGGGDATGSGGGGHGAFAITGDSPSTSATSLSLRGGGSGGAAAAQMHDEDAQHAEAARAVLAAMMSPPPTSLSSRDDAALDAVLNAPPDLSAMPSRGGNLSAVRGEEEYHRTLWEKGRDRQGGLALFNTLLRHFCHELNSSHRRCVPSVPRIHVQLRGHCN